MTLIYIHGVKVRSPRQGEALEQPFRRWLLARLEQDAAYAPVFWGDLAADFRWGLDSRPRTPILSAGGAPEFPGLGSLRSTGQSTVLDRAVAAPKPAVAGPVLGASAVPVKPAIPPLATIPAKDRADFLADFYLAARQRDRAVRKGEDLLVALPDLGALAAAADTVAGQWNQIVAKYGDDSERAVQLLAAVDRELSGTTALLSQGGFGDWLTGAGELLGRAVTMPGDAVSTVFGEARPLLHDFIANFLGDVLVYLNQRVDSEGAPGRIPQRVLDALRAAHRRKRETGEKIVVVTHSMGGQLLYDAVTAFAPNIPELDGLEIDHWITCGAQVSFFAELGLLRGQPDIRTPEKLPRPACVKAWTNFYDTNDPVGFIMKPVFDGVRDLEYDTGYGLFLAHTGFLGRPSFFTAMAGVI
jgi:hypothetical protein